MSLPSYRIALIFPANFNYSFQLTEGAARYSMLHRNLILTEIPILQHGVSPLPNEEYLPFDGALTLLDTQDSWVSQLLEQFIPVCNANGEFLDDDRVVNLGFTNMETCKMAAEYLAELNRKNTAYIGLETSITPTFQRKEQTFLSIANQLGLTTHRFEIQHALGPVNQPTSLEEPEETRLRSFLSNLPKPASLWCEDDYIARIVCNLAQLEEISIPADLAVLGTGDYCVCRFGNPMISTLPQPGHLVGFKGLEILHNILSQQSKPTGLVSVPSPPIIERESTGMIATDKRFQEIYEWMTKQACKGITVGEVADNLQMSRMTFTKRFEMIFRRPPGEVIRKARADRAAQYLRNTDFSIERIANLCGFLEAANFSRFFKKQTGISPSKYRKGKASS